MQASLFFLSCLSAVIANNCQDVSYFPSTFTVGEYFPLTGYSQQEFKDSNIQIVSPCTFSFYPNTYLASQEIQLYAVGQFGYYPIPIETYGASYVINLATYSWSEFSAVYMYSASTGSYLGQVALPTGVQQQQLGTNMPSCGKSAGSVACGNVTPANQNQNGGSTNTNSNGSNGSNGNGSNNVPSNGGANPNSPAPIVIGSVTVTTPTATTIPIATPRPSSSVLKNCVPFGFLIVSALFAFF